MKKRIHRLRRYFLNGLSYILGTDSVLAAPLHIHIETTNICNFKCVYCAQSRPEEHFKILGKGKMPLDKYKKIIDKLSALYKIEWLVLTRDGEPLVNPDLEQFIAYGVQKGIKAAIGSNGSLITAERAETLIDAGLRQMKGDFCTDRVYFEQIRAGSDYDAVLNGYQNIVKAAEKKNVPFVLTLVDLKTFQLESETEIQESIKQLKKLFKEGRHYISVNRAKMHNALGEAQENFSSSKKKGTRHYNRCHHPWFEMVIDYKGNVVGCCRDLRSEYQAGNILEADDINRDIWNGKKMRSLRKNLRKKQPEKVNICSKCDLPYGESYAGSSISGKIRKFLT